MKKLNRSILCGINRCIAFIVPLFGLVPFHSCTTVVDMYGVPLVKFEVNGRVENKLGKGIEGIEISIYDTPLDTTNADGTFNFTIRETEPLGVELLAHDIDSTENGHYEDKYFYMRDSKDVVITLEEKEQNNEETNN